MCWFAAIFMIRASIASMLFASGESVAVAAACVELLLLWYTCLNVVRAEVWDQRPVGALIPALYLLSFCIVTDGRPDETWAVILAAALVGLSAWVVLSLGDGVTIARSNVTRLRTSGPYALIRHPMYLVQLLTRVAFVAANPTAWNLAAAVLLVVVVLAVILIEEQFLAGWPEWVAYAHRVRFRLVPGVW